MRYGNENRTSRIGIRGVCELLLFALICTAPLMGQVTVGDDLKLHLRGDFGFSYGGSFGTFGSGHGTGVVGNGILSGVFYDPRFINFEIRPYYNRNQDTGSIGFINDTEGVTATTNIFSGSKTPGSFIFSKSYGSGSAYGIPGASLYTNDNSTRSFVVNWSLLFPSLPSFTVNYNDTSSSSSLLDTVDVTSGTKDLNLSTRYRWAGFDLNGVADFTRQHSKTPAFLDTTFAESHSSGSLYSLQASHALPFNGTTTMGVYHSDYTFDGVNSGGNTFFAGAGINPTRRLTINGGIRHTSNELGQLQRDLFGSPLLAPTVNNSSSTSFDASASYIIFRGLSANGFVGQIRQTYNDREDVRNVYGVSTTYMNSIPFLGYFRFGVALVDYYNNNQGNNGQGVFNLNGSLSRKLGKWEIGVDGTYGQSVVSRGSWMTTSSYSYGGNVQRRFTPTLMIFSSYRANRSALTLVDGNHNQAQSATAGFNSPRVGISGTWSQSSGSYLLTPAGVFTPTPVAGALTDQFANFDANGVGASASFHVFRGATITGGWNKSKSDTFALIQSRNESRTSYLRLRYRMRKLVVWGTYRRLDQEISASGAPPRNSNSFSIQVTRYFNVF
jgi:hypothetical protein